MKVSYDNEINEIANDEHHDHDSVIFKVLGDMDHEGDVPANVVESVQENKQVHRLM